MAIGIRFMFIDISQYMSDNAINLPVTAIMISLFVGSGGLLFGYDIGIINGILAMDTFKKDFAVGADDKILVHQSALIVSILSLGAIAGSLLAAPAADSIGRRLSLLISIGVFCFGVIFQILAYAIPMLLVGRLFSGIGIGGLSLLVPLYQSEISPKWIRGALICNYQFAITIGFLAAAGVNIITNNIQGTASYRIPLFLQFTWAFCLAIGLLMLPETPRYLIKAGNIEAALLSLSRIRLLDISHPALTEELAEIEANYAYELSQGPDTYKEIVFGRPHLGRRTLTGCCLQMLQHMIGISFILYYGTTFFLQAGVNNPFLISLIIQIINSLSTIPGIVMVESWGRRKLLIVGAIGMAACQLLIASFITIASNKIKATANEILIIFICIYVFLFAASWGPVVWVVTSEIYPLKVRAKSISVSISSNWVLNFALAYGTPYMVEQGSGTADMGAKIFFLWGAFCILAVFFVWFMVYETSKLSLEQIDEMYERVDYAWNSTNFEPNWSFQLLQHHGYSDSGIPPASSEPTTSAERT